MKKQETMWGETASLNWLKMVFFKTKKIEGQIKGTTVPQEITGGLYYSLPMETKTLNYGLHASNAFVLFLVILKGGKGKERVYYLPIQEYFIEHPEQHEKLKSGQKKLSVHIPKKNLVTSEDEELQRLAKTTYYMDSENNLRKIVT